MINYTMSSKQNIMFIKHDILIQPIIDVDNYVSQCESLYVNSVFEIRQHHFGNFQPSMFTLLTVKHTYMINGKTIKSTKQITEILIYKIHHIFNLQHGSKCF